METRKRLGLNPGLCCAPIFFGLANSAGFECVVDVVAKNAINMRGRNLDAAFLSPIDYARESSDYRIVPNVALSSRTPSDTIALHFKESLHTVTTIAVHPTSTSEIVLASILLGERFDVRPKIVPVMGPLDQMLRSADSALLVGNDAFEQAQVHRNRIDLVEEWADMTDLPYVHGFWCVREPEVTKEDVGRIQQACADGIKALDRIVQVEAAKHPQCATDVLRKYLGSFSFTFTDEEQEGVMEFLRFAYYYGILPDVPDLSFYPLDTEEGSPISGVSLN